METFPSRSFVDLLRLIAKKPGFYLAPDEHGDCRSIRELYSFILGFQMRQHVKDDASVLNEFTFWVCHHYGVADGAMSWCDHILEHAGRDQAAAFQLFFDHFEEYLKERETIGPEVIKARFISMLEQLHRDEDHSA